MTCFQPKWAKASPIVLEIDIEEMEETSVMEEDNQR